MRFDYLANDLADITTHDSNAQSDMYGIYVGVGGDVKVKTGQGSIITLKNVPTGTIIPLYNPSLIYATGTTATNLVAMKNV